jgi:hypothetical protein
MLRHVLAPEAFHTAEHPDLVVAALAEPSQRWTWQRGDDIMISSREDGLKWPISSSER